MVSLFVTCGAVEESTYLRIQSRTTVRSRYAGNTPMLDRVLIIAVQGLARRNTLAAGGDSSLSP